MIHVTAQDLEAILSTVDRALEMHGQWRDQLQRTLICKLPPRETDMADDAHHHCAFGQWFYSAGNAHLRKLPAFKQIEDLHAVMHGHARELCIRLKGHWAITPKEYDPFIERMAEFRNALLGMRHKVEDTLRKIDPLTGAFVSAQLLPELRAEQAAQRQTGRPYSLLLLRFDLAEINRSRGHEAGDVVLRAGIGGILQSLDPEDKVYRFSGAEFVICLPGKDRAQAEGSRERMLAAVAQSLASTAGTASAALQVHYGIVALEPDAYIEKLIHSAALATYTIQL